ncbi:uncharacterized protein LOC126882590 [Diabrotica virgifera virgifera]|uniref:CCHC-type domain-containing protein n=1 Tax=Diabrotica virgifera virgifera TaxID=50390 RepID=A0ABM5K005_DIAVI|nr:uncharacterized protein LOC126882590 [Diabrotica virgifera virgifera]
MAMANKDLDVSSGSTTINMPVQVNPPEKFTFSQPNMWPQWRKRFQRFMSVSGQDQKPEKDKIDILMYIMGDEAEEIVLQFPKIPATYSEMLQSFENHFIPRRNVIFERFKFNSRIQQPGEAIEHFITSLHSLAEYCDYSTLKEELIRDRIVVGMSDTKTSERLQLQGTLTLKDCIIVAKQAEMQANQTLELRNENRYHPTQEVAKVAVQNRERGNVTGSFQKADNIRRKNFQGDTCMFCGQQSHSREVCPARRSQCNKCKKFGHWASVCLSGKGQRENKVSTVEIDNFMINSEGNNLNFVGSVYINNIEAREWLISVLVFELRTKFEFLIDSGEDVSCIPSSLMPKEILKTLCKPYQKVTGPSGIKLEVVGTLPVTLCHNNDISKTQMLEICRQYCEDDFLTEKGQM